MIALIDYGMGNIGSIKNILHKVGADDVVISHDADVIRRADKMILPGVGAYDAGMHNLEKYGLIEVIKNCAMQDHKPILGICLGMQLLGRNSEEGECEGLGLIPFENKKFRVKDELKVPHMGWNYVKIKREQEPLMQNLGDDQRYYFVHSYHAVCDKDENILMTCEYGYEFVAAVVRDQIYGVQFHPEKSHHFGMRLFKNFVEEC